MVRCFLDVQEADQTIEEAVTEATVVEMIVVMIVAMIDEGREVREGIVVLAHLETIAIVVEVVKEIAVTKDLLGTTAEEMTGIDVTTDATHQIVTEVQVVAPATETTKTTKLQTMRQRTLRSIGKAAKLRETSFKTDAFCD